MNLVLILESATDRDLTWAILDRARIDLERVHLVVAGGSSEFLRCIMQDYRKLVVWQKAHELCLEVYKITKEFPSDERFGLVQQMRRSSSSVPTNIAEGCGRSTKAAKANFFDISAGSCNEVEYQIFLAKDLGFLNDTSYEVLYSKASEIRRMLAGLIEAVRRHDS